MAFSMQVSERVPAPTCDDDAALLSAAQADERGRVLLWSRYSPMVTGLVRRFFGPGADHPDVCQEVFLRVFRRMDEVRDPRALRGFIVGICLGVSRNELRRMRIRRFVGLSAHDSMPDVPIQPADAEAREALQALYRLLDKFSAEDRSLFVARYMEAMELTEVASAHHWSLATAKRRLAWLSRRMEARVKGDTVLSEYLNGLSPHGDR
jgi:RNA polymerase sigma-70 factor (ECF subfamily)